MPILENPLGQTPVILFNFTNLYWRIKIEINGVVVVVFAATIRFAAEDLEKVQL